ncbi:HNH endonuclease [Rhodococcus sp. NPDC127528]|uniref:HNH endonuclease n=1 Tax=unclassified Rhodococcus (in: high G+C Gram-positive bacteria) TaxID=192944 RepID=UPI00363137B8
MPTKVTRTHGERMRRAQAVAAHRLQHGNWCPGHGVPAHAATDLTADHTTPIAQGGAPDGPLGVLCRSCNSRKAARDTVRGAPT